MISQSTGGQKELPHQLSRAVLLLNNFTNKMKPWEVVVANVMIIFGLMIEKIQSITKRNKVD